MSAVKLDLDDTSRCPLAPTCHWCGGSNDLEVVTVLSPVGVLCSTLCEACIDLGRVPTVNSWAQACALVCDHCEHIGRDLDDAAALLDAEARS